MWGRRLAEISWFDLGWCTAQAAEARTQKCVDLLSGCPLLFISMCCLRLFVAYRYLLGDCKLLCVDFYFLLSGCPLLLTACSYVLPYTICCLQLYVSWLQTNLSWLLLILKWLPFLFIAIIHYSYVLPSKGKSTICCLQIFAKWLPTTLWKMGCGQDILYKHLSSYLSLAVSLVIILISHLHRS